MTIIASESCHFYDKTGSPCYTVIGKNGQERNANLADCKKNGWLPSVSEILKIYPRPFLAEWKINQHIQSALTIPQVKSETSEELIKRIKEDAAMQAEKAREMGTLYHAAIEKFLSSYDYKTMDADLLKMAQNAIYELSVFLRIPPDILLPKSSPEKSFASPLGYGGKVDLHSKELNFICDFKCKEFDESKIDKLVYPEHRIQLMAYANGLGMPDARLVNVFISTNNPWLAKVIEYIDDRQYYTDVFLKTYDLWKALKKYDPLGKGRYNG